jgi:hypothetical protein
MNTKTSIVIITIVILLAVVVFPVSAYDPTIKPGTQAWADTYFKKEVVEEKKTGLIEAILDVFAEKPEPVSYKVAYPYEVSFEKTTVVVDKVTKIPSIVTVTEPKRGSSAMLERTSVYVNQTDLKKTGRATGFIKGVVHK